MIRQRDEILDLIRGLSAMVVLFAHVRGFVLVDFAEVIEKTTFIKGFYFATGLHHQAVMVFFVLSGYFVGGSVIEAFRENRFSVSRYSLSRISRLWVVLFPALILTMVLDSIGRGISPEAYLGGFRDIFMSGPEQTPAPGFSPTVFLGNLAFLQTVEVPVYGSNGPLWSLANEFWYYVLFPLVVYTFVSFRASSIERLRYIYALVTVTAFVLLCCWLPWSIVSKGAIWLLGVGVWMTTQKISLVTNHWKSLWFLAGATSFAATLVLSKGVSCLGSDFAVGLAFALWMPSLLGSWPKRGWWQRVGDGLSAISYTLYVIHFPLLFLISVAFLHGVQFQPDTSGMVCFFCLSTVSVSAASGMWWLFERHTNNVRRWVGRNVFSL